MTILLAATEEVTIAELTPARSQLARRNAYGTPAFSGTSPGLADVRGSVPPLANMTRSSRISVWVASSALVVCLFAIAAPAVAASVREMALWFSPVPAAAPGDATEFSEAVDVEPVTREASDAFYPRCTELYYPALGEGLDHLVDNGPQEFATGEVGLEDGVPTTYTVAPGDAILAIGSRFCTFGLFYFNDIHLKGTIYPGDVLRLRPEREI